MSGQSLSHDSGPEDEIVDDRPTRAEFERLQELNERQAIMVMEAQDERDEALASLREVYGYMCEVENMLAGQVAVRSYMSLPREEVERVEIGKRARRIMGIEEPA